MAAFAAIPLAAQDNYPPTIPDARVETFKSVGDVDLNVWIFGSESDEDSPPRPAVLFFFGGYWLAGSPAQFEGQAKHLASRGMIAVLADYRVFGRNGTPATAAVEDAKSAIRWVRANADRLGIDPSRIAASGGSSGGHLAVATATLPGYDDPAGDSAISSAPDALVLFNPVLVMAPVPGQPETANSVTPDLAERLGTDEPESLSPYHHVKAGLPPTLILHGTADTDVSYSLSELFTEAMQAVGNRSELVGYEGREHGFFNPTRGDGSDYGDTLRRMDAFLVSLGWFSAP